ncbi:MAG: DUF177 domain-containing protein [Proteobacteria bacterium]|jgi:uncharacterized metal-binding protein YceD (DUF177 family)|nr:DUF177 domain-containing protein [Pseudomonadota bacterium]
MNSVSADASGSFSLVLTVVDLPAAGWNIHLSANEADRDAIRARLGILGLDAMSIEGTVIRVGKDKARLDATLNAKVTQACVVTLDPVHEVISEDVVVNLIPEPEGEDTGVLDLDADEEDTEWLVDGTVDVAELAIQHLALLLDPYPRSESGAAAAAESIDGFEDRRESPFAVLQNLKDKA